MLRANDCMCCACVEKMRLLESGLMEIARIRKFKMFRFIARALLLPDIDTMAHWQIDMG